MTADRWQRAKQLFDQALELERTGRASFLQVECAGDDEMLEEVESLLSIEDQDSDKNLLSPLETLDDSVLGWSSVEGHIFGHYKIIRILGEGGMGAVYLGERADQQFQRKVAIKLVRPELVDARTLRWFEKERKTLAALDHPNIVKLLDGGTEEGIPYLVMDYVEGETIDRYCVTKQASRTDVLHLFRAVCGAVHYAHQSLVVHRDLKPSNIVVTPDGSPRLLDFGIAKLLNPEYQTDGSRTRTEVQPRTPAYASPEQIKGSPVTTASDVYALGVLLYRLLVGRHPYAGEIGAQGDVEYAICNLDPPPPDLDKDLDTIVLKAMHRDAQRRYASAEHLSEDLRRYLTGLPVLARGDGLGYRLAKFAGRHRAGVASAALAAVALVASTGISAWYARMAEFEKNHAEKRFQDVRQLAKFVLFDLDESIRSGAGGARNLTVDRALEYLDLLNNDPGADSYLKKDIIEGYLRVGDVQGNPHISNLGYRRAALQSYQKALDVAATLGTDDKDRQLYLGRAQHRMGDLLALEGKHNEALRNLRRSARLLSTVPGSGAAAELQTVAEHIATLESGGAVR